MKHDLGEKLEALRALEELQTFLSGKEFSISLSDFITKVFDLLDTSHCVICGGIALNQYAKPRYTDDLDLILLSSDVDKFKRVLESNGFVLDEIFDYGAKLITYIHRMKYKERYLDLVTYSSKEFTEFLLSSAVQHKIPGYSKKAIKILSPEGMVLTKAITTREHQDLGDIERMIVAGEKIDWDIVKGWLQDLGKFNKFIEIEKLLK